jgi:hypothetical protein
MVTTSPRGQSLLARIRDSSLLERVLRRADGFVHHRLPALSAGDRPVPSARDECSLHDGAAAPPATYEEVTSLLEADLDEDGYVNPVLTAGDVTDYGDVNYVADPFLLLAPDRWDLYFEVYNADREPTAVIGHARSTDGGHTWDYKGLALDPGVHASFPYVFRWDGSTWMVPNLDPDGAVGRVPLYESADGTTFTERTVLADPEVSPTDRVVFRFDGRWWLLVSVASTCRELRVYHSERLTVPNWQPHEANPVSVDEPRIPGGRPVVTDDRVVAFFQNGTNYYGEVVEAYEITELTPGAYADRKVRSEPMVSGTGSRLGWNSARMHTFDPWYTGDRWVCAVDGDTALGSSVVGPHWSIGLYATPVDR